MAEAGAGKPEQKTISAAELEQLRKDRESLAKEVEEMKSQRKVEVKPAEEIFKCPSCKAVIKVYEDPCKTCGKELAWSE